MPASSNVRLQATFETFDLNLASFLRCRGLVIGDIYDSGGRAVFVFKDRTELRQAVLDYANDGPIGVRSFCNTLRDLKALIRDVGGSEWKGLNRGNGK